MNLGRCKIYGEILFISPFQASHRCLALIGFHIPVAVISSMSNICLTCIWIIPFTLLIAVVRMSSLLEP
jgi:hypothetical protein